jgi:hypothetical protein
VNPSPLQVAVRLWSPDDEAFVFRNWLKSCRRCALHSGLPADVYFADHHAAIERLLHARTYVSLHVGAGEGGELYGFIATETISAAPRILHFADVKSERRRQGVFRQLAAGVGLDLTKPFFYTAHPPAATPMARAFPLAKYSPRILALLR